MRTRLLNLFYACMFIFLSVFLCFCILLCFILSLCPCLCAQRTTNTPPPCACLFELGFDVSRGRLRLLCFLVRLLGRVVRLLRRGLRQVQLATGDRFGFRGCFVVALREIENYETKINYK